MLKRNNNLIGLGFLLLFFQLSYSVIEASHVFPGYKTVRLGMPLEEVQSLLTLKEAVQDIRNIFQRDEYLRVL